MEFCTLLQKTFGKSFGQPIDFWGKIRYDKTAKYGGIAQLARAFGSYPKCRRFKSCCRYQKPPELGAFYGPLVKRLRHGPFTAETGVRFPYGSPRRSRSLLRRFFVTDKNPLKKRGAGGAACRGTGKIAGAAFTEKARHDLIQR